MIDSPSYVLITAAKDEDLYIEHTINSILCQSVLPSRWVIVSDGSTDGTNEIVRKYAANHSFIDFVPLPPKRARNFDSKVRAVNLGYNRMKELSFNFIGNLDADITFDERYYEKIFEKFREYPDLGIAGGFIHENMDGTFRSRPSNSIFSVAGAIQIFRRKCYEAIGGHRPIRIGGEDWYLEISARMKKWQVRSFPEIAVYHHKPITKVSGRLLRNYKEGRKDFLFGSIAFFEILKVTRRLRERPYVLGAAARLIGFLKASICRESKLVDSDFASFLRKEQLMRIRSTLGLFLRNQD